MKNRKWWYTVATFIAALLVTCSVLMPGILLSKTEDSILNSPYTVNVGIFSSQQSRPNVAGTSAIQTATSVQQLTQSARLFKQDAATSVLANEPFNGSMNINEAVGSCVKQITALLLKKALPPLTGFPQGYGVYAELRTITDDHSKQTLQYWTINFFSPPAPTSKAKFSISLDAQTGSFLSLDLSTQITSSMSVKASQIDLVHSTNVIAQSMNIPGKMLSVDQSQVPSTARWQFNNSLLILQVTLDQRHTSTNFGMNLDIK